MAKTKKAMKLEALEDVASTVSAVEARFQEAQRAAEIAAIAVERRITFASKVADDLAAKLSKVQEIGNMVSFMPFDLYNSLFGDLPDVERAINAFMKQAEADKAKELADAARNPYLQWVRAQEDAKVHAEELERQRLADELEAARLRKVEEDRLADEAREAKDKAHADAVKAAQKRINAENSRRLEEARKNGAYTHWQSIALGLRRQAVREAHQKKGGKPSPAEVLDMLTILVSKNMPSEALIQGEVVDGEAVVSAAYVFAVKALAKWADSQPKDTQMPAPAPVVEEPVVEAVPQETAVVLVQQVQKSADDDDEDEGKAAYEARKAKKAATRARREARRESGGSSKGRSNSRGAEYRAH